MTDRILKDVIRTEQSGHDRLTRIAEAMTVAMEQHPEYQEGDKAVVMLDDTIKGGIAIVNYEDDVDCIPDIIDHLRAIFEANNIPTTLKINFTKEATDDQA